MGTCFVIQPFDSGPFDKRFEDVITPAIENAGLEPYRVDRDPSVRIPIEDIENGIRNSVICLAEITLDNPNVWFELGYAIAVPKEVILLCSGERKGVFPFDIHHRNVLKYKTESTRDFDEIQLKITQKIEAILKKQHTLDTIGSQSPIAKMEGLSQQEIVALVAIMENNIINDSNVTASYVNRDMNNLGYTPAAVSLALICLEEKGYIVKNWYDGDFNQSGYNGYHITNDGQKWIISNQNLLKLKSEPNSTKENIQYNTEPGQIDDLPF